MNRHEFIINQFKEELLFSLSLDSKKMLNEQHLGNLEYELKNIKKIVNNLDEKTEDVKTLFEYIETAEKLIKKFDDSKLIKIQFYLTKAQISYIDDIADFNNLKGKGRRGQALRLILDDNMRELMND